MKYRRLGKTGLRISVVGFGAWQFGGEWSKNFTQSEASLLLARAAERGINFIDTAECYGDGLSESLIGGFLEGSRGDWVVATKFGHKFHGLFDRTQHFGASEVTGQLENSLRNLKTDHVDLYQFHSGPDEAFDNQELWAALNKLVKEGKVRCLGVSIGGNDNLHQTEAASAVGASVIQVVYNRLDRKAEERVLPSCERHGLGVLARVPLASGFLSGKYKEGDEDAFGKDDVRGHFWTKERRAEAIRQVVEIKKNELPKGAEMASWALSWCLKHTAVSAVIPGMKTVTQVDSNARAADFDEVSVGHPQSWKE